MMRRPPRSTLFPLHDALPIYMDGFRVLAINEPRYYREVISSAVRMFRPNIEVITREPEQLSDEGLISLKPDLEDRKSTRLNSSHANISYAVFCLKKNHKSQLP